MLEEEWQTTDSYPIEIGGVKRDLRLFEIKPGLKIAILNILGDTELVQACAEELSKKLAIAIMMFSSPRNQKASRWRIHSQSTPENRM